MNNILEKVKEIYFRANNLTESDITTIVDYLNLYIFNGKMLIEYTSNPPRENIVSLDVTTATPKMLISLNQNPTFQYLFESFIYVAYLYKQLEDSKTNAEYNTMFKILEVLSNYCRKYKYDFYSANYAYFELDAHLKTYDLLLNNIGNNEWTFLKKERDSLKRKRLKYQVLDLLKPFNYLNKSYLPYDRHLVDSLIRVALEDDSILKKEPTLAKYFSTSKDLVAMLLDYYEDDFFLAKYIILYLIENNSLMRKETILKIKSLSPQEKIRVYNVINKLGQDNFEKESFLLHHTSDLKDYFDEETDNLLIYCNAYVKVFKSRTELINTFLKYCNENQIFS